MTVSRRISTPIGELRIIGDGESVSGLYFPPHPQVDEPGDPGAFEEAVRQLEQWFAGERAEFELKLDPQGTPFQHRVWEALLEIPYGETVSYLEIATRAGNPRAARPAGQAIGRNPISIIVPCHRVIGSNGSLTGYGGGMERKVWLLEHERRVSARQIKTANACAGPDGPGRDAARPGG
jgi:methylated-DNA-[protein]-cysteine S-methyltransferase